jgi:hypothetical protein
MPERWERELAKLHEVDVREPVVRERVDRGPRADTLQPRRDRLIAGVVAGAVAIAALGFLWRTSPGTSDRVGKAAAELPVLSVSFHDSEVIPEGPDSSYRRVQTTISYGAARDEDFTSTTTLGAIVEWVSVDDLTRFLPGPTVGSRIEFEADGNAPRALIGEPDQWPNFERFTEIEQLPEVPGDYVLVFEADYPEGAARTARYVHLVEPDVLQLVATEGGEPDAASAAAYVDGDMAEGALSGSWYTASDFGLQLDPRSPEFASDAWLPIPVGSRMVLATSATSATGGFFESYEAFDPNAPLPNDLLEGTATIEEPSGRRLLAVDVTWVHPSPGGGDSSTTERALFFFPIEITGAPEPTEPPPTEASPSPVPANAVMIDIRRSTEGTSGDPQATANFDDQDVSMCPNGWSLIEPDGTSSGWVIFDCGQNEEFTAPAGTPIFVEGDYTSLEATAQGLEDRTEHGTDQVPAVEPGSVVSYTFDVTWADGSEASFWLVLTVSEAATTTESSVLRIRCGTEGAEVLTPDVVAQPDGVHVEVENPAGAASLAFALAVSPDGSSFSGTLVDAGRVWPIDPGEFFVECLEMPSDVYLGLRTARFEVVDPNGFWVPGTPECAEDDSLLKIQAYDGGGADYVNDEMAIRALLHSIEPMDEVRLPGYPEGPGVKEGRYVVVRDGRVVAVVFVGLSEEEDPEGPGLTKVTGEACASSGIAQGGLG